MGTSRSDDDGAYSIRGLTGEAVEVAIFARGFLPRVLPAQAGKVDVRLARGMSLAGTLLTAEGKPASDREVEFRLLEPIDPKDLRPWKRKGYSYMPYFSALTDAKGAFRIDGLPAGEYRLREPNEAPAIKVISGTSNLDIRLRPLLSVAGHVVDEKGQPAISDGKSRLRVSASFGGRTVGSAMLEDDGSFTLTGLPQGSITLDVNGYPRYKSKRIHVQAGSQNVRFQLEPSPYRDRKR